MVTVQENACLDGLKVARIVESKLNVHNVIEDLAEKLFLSIRNFETRSEAMLWLLFDKAPEGH
ncbi:MAG: hypothetical protein JKY14_13495 [Paraglaciecola sp.]|nr:hypothetical protein [Paraglaciecola sp.]